MAAGPGAGAAGTGEAVTRGAGAPTAVGVGAAGTVARSGRCVRTKPTTWRSVGQSRRRRFSIRGIDHSSRTAANVSACLTVSTPRSASRSRSRSSRSVGYPVFAATIAVTRSVIGSAPVTAGAGTAIIGTADGGDAEAFTRAATAAAGAGTGAGAGATGDGCAVTCAAG